MCKLKIYRYFYDISNQINYILSKFFFHRINYNFLQSRTIVKKTCSVMKSASNYNRKYFSNWPPTNGI